MGRQKVLLVANAVHDTGRREVIGIAGGTRGPRPFNLLANVPGTAPTAHAASRAGRGPCRSMPTPQQDVAFDNQRVQANPDRCNGASAPP